LLVLLLLLLLLLLLSQTDSRFHLYFCATSRGPDSYGSNAGPTGAREGVKWGVQAGRNS